MRALIIASVASMIDQFNMNNIRVLQKLGYQVDVACNFENPGTITEERVILLKARLRSLGVSFFQIDFSRNVFAFLSHFRAGRQIEELFKKSSYQIVHCHSPIGGLLARLISSKYRKRMGTIVIYTAHGFHFFKGAPIRNWIVYYPIEKMCSKLTDVLITINKEDYEFAKNKMKAKAIEYIPGIGIDVKKFSSVEVDRNKKRDELGIPRDAYLILSVGELNKNKNHQAVIKAIAKLSNPSMHYMIAGVGKQEEHLQKMAKKLGVHLHTIGYRNDVAELYKTADLFIHPSLREGLPVSMMEAIASGCKIIASNTRGNRDLLPKEFLFNPRSVAEISSLLLNVPSPQNLSCEKFDYSFVDSKMERIYRKEG